MVAITFDGEIRFDFYDQFLQKLYNSKRMGLGEMSLYSILERRTTNSTHTAMVKELIRAGLVERIKHEGAVTRRKEPSVLYRITKAGEKRIELIEKIIECYSISIR